MERPRRAATRPWTIQVMAAASPRPVRVQSMSRRRRRDPVRSAGAAPLAVSVAMATTPTAVPAASSGVTRASKASRHAAPSTLGTMRPCGAVFRPRTAATSSAAPTPLTRTSSSFPCKSGEVSSHAATASRAAGLSFGATLSSRSITTESASDASALPRKRSMRSLAGTKSTLRRVRAIASAMVA